MEWVHEEHDVMENEITTNKACMHTSSIKTQKRTTSSIPIDMTNCQGNARVEEIR